MKTLKIGFIGAGGIVLQRHLPGLRQLPGLEINAVANSTLASAEAFCATHAPKAQPMACWQDVVALPDLDIVWIGATPYLHEPATIAALEAGKHVFCQARMARNLAEAERMLAATEQRPDQVTMLCPPPQGLRGDAYFRQLLADKIVGEVRHIGLRSLNSAFLDPNQPAHWRQHREISGENILTLGIHTEVLQRWFGDFSVEAARGQIFTPIRAGSAVEVPDSLQVLVRFATGASGTLEFSGIHAGEPAEHLEIRGSLGTLVYDYGREEIRLWKKGSSAWEVLPIPETLARDWQVEADFINAVRDPSAPRPSPTFTDGVRYMTVVQAVSAALNPR